MKRNNVKRMQEDPDMLEEYDFSQGIRGNMQKDIVKEQILWLLTPIVAEFFPDHDSVNKALRLLTEIIKDQKRTSNKSLKLTSEPRT
jgi:cell fate (sporulation/competence/biofilm development) regulator YmcA (YheA/YmcA/DUF963 family)